MKYFIDKHDRQVRYLRLSVTDRCNLACMYCRDENSYIPHDKILRYEEMKSLIRVALKRGINKLRLTGGEPFARKDFVPFLEDLAESFPTLDLRITTNGTLIKEHIPLIQKLNIKINLSLDTFNKELFKEIAGKDLLDETLANMHEMLQREIPLKINAVAMKTKNDSDLEQFIELARKYPIDVRFIEFMPMGEETIWAKNLYWSADEILEQASAYAKLSLVKEERNRLHRANSGPARLYTIENGKGRLGLISPISSHFCKNCNRLRITSSGALRTCLFDDKEYDLIKLIREDKASDSTIEKYIEECLQNKAMGYELLERNKNKVASTHMVSIGG